MALNVLKLTETAFFSYIDTLNIKFWNRRAESYYGLSFQYFTVFWAFRQVVNQVSENYVI